MARALMRCLFRIVAAAVLSTALPVLAADPTPAAGPPQYKVDIGWPKLPLPNNWALGVIGGLFVDSKDHVWLVQRPNTLEPWAKGAATNPPHAICCIPAPPVIEFDQDGNVVQAWGGPGQGYEWPSNEHGIFVDHKNNVWIGGNATRAGRGGRPADGMVVKFSRDGKFLMQIGHAGPSKGSLDQTQLGGAADIAVDATTNEAFIADGYGNHRVIVFDADTGKFKRLWGAYGKPPTDDKVGPYDPSAPPPPQFRIVHCIRVSKDGFVYVCDRDNNRMQVFKRDGTFVAEYTYAKQTIGTGSVGSISFWPDAQQSILALADLGNFQTRLVRRADGKELTVFGHFGTYAGEIDRNHQTEFDSRGNLYISENYRVQKFTLVSGQRPK